MEKAEFRRYGHAFVDWVADYLDNVRGLRVVPDSKPGEIRSALPPTPPLKPESMDALFRDFREIILPAAAEVL